MYFEIIYKIIIVDPTAQWISDARYHAQKKKNQ